MRHHALLCVLCLILSARTLAAELTPLVNGNRVGILIHGLSLPASLNKDLKSGLTNRILIRVTLLADSRVVDRKAVEVDVTYDLWDENFRLTVNLDHKVVHTEVIATIGAVLATVSSPSLPDVFVVSAATREASYTLKGEILLNPIEREKLDKLRKWVEENNSNATATGSGLPDPTGLTAPLPTTSASDPLFNRLFEQYARGDDIAAFWHMTLVSSAFTIPGSQHGDE
jgi:hypothetical protein